MSAASQKNVWDTGRWSSVAAIDFDFMTRYIMEQLAAAVDFRGKTVLELGAGLGRLSSLALRAGARHVTLVDSSRKALELERRLFVSEDPARYTIMDSDLFAVPPDFACDLVLSSGVIEHFEGEDRRRIIVEHWRHTRQDCLIVHPTATLYAAFYKRLPMSRRLYGVQEPFTEEEIAGYVSQLEGVGDCRHRQFHFFYYVPLLHNLSLNRLIDRLAAGRLGGLTLTHVRRG